jgi:type IV pilus assembly protein PilK
MSMELARRQQPITGNQMQLLMQQLRSKAGIIIETPRSVIERNVQDRITALGLGNSGEYFSLLEDSIGARAEWLALIDLLSVKETRFFRQPAAFEHLADYVGGWLSEQSGQPLSIWSAGCSTGQELYSIAMLVESLRTEHQSQMEWCGIGTDISFEAVSQSQRARYPETALLSVPSHFRERFLRCAEEDEWELCESIRSRTHFFHSNLLHVNGAPFSDFDIIFCQNVLIYFEQETQNWIIDQLVERLAPGGVLLLGAGEDVWWDNPVMRRQSWPGVCAYKKAEV